MKCNVHTDTELICPRCLGAQGGKKRQARLTRQQRSDLGKRASWAKKERAPQGDRFEVHMTYEEMKAAAKEAIQQGRTLGQFLIDIPGSKHLTLDELSVWTAAYKEVRNEEKASQTGPTH